MALWDRQYRLLLWKDYLIRKRKIITLAGIIWATLVMMSLYIVRVNVNNVDYPTCQFPARALPSAGMITFLQSFICNVNNECETMDKYEEIPSFEKSRLTHIQRQLSPLIYNESLINVASAVPDALKMLGTVSQAVDEPTFLHISKNGLRVKDLFRDPRRVKRYILISLDLPEDVVDSLLDAEISLQGVLRGNMNKCDPQSLSGTILTSPEVLEELVKRICPLSDKELQDMILNIALEINFDKYIKMIGNMYEKLNGDTRISVLSDTLSALIRISNLESFVPPELFTLLTGVRSEQFTYYNLTLITKLLNLYEPTFGNTESYKSIRGFADAAVSGIQWLYKLILQKDNTSSVNEVTGLVLDQVELKFNKNGDDTMSDGLNNALDTLKEDSLGLSLLDDIFNVLPKLTNFVMRWLKKSTKHEIVFYSTLLSKLLESARKVISDNINLESITYDVTMRNVGAVQILINLPPSVISKAFDALTDAERTQVVTSKLNNPGQMFCDPKKLQKFFAISKEEAAELKTKLCTDPWMKYVQDLITSFGIYDVKKKINEMASLVIQETLGKDTSSQLYTMDQFYDILKSIIEELINLNTKPNDTYDWDAVLKTNDSSDFMKIIKEKSKLGKQILITVHGALAKEIVKQNSILDIKISPILKQITTLILGMNRQLNMAPKDLLIDFKRMYPDVLQTMLMTFLDEDKAYHLLSMHSEDIFCNNTEDTSNFLILPSDVNSPLASTLCRMSKEIENGLASDSILGKVIKSLQSFSNSAFNNGDWTNLINGLKVLYTTLNNDYPYLFEFMTYNMSNETKMDVERLMGEVRVYWFGRENIGRSLQISINTIFRTLDLIDRDIFSLDGEIWYKLKHSLNSANGLLVIFDEIVKLITMTLDNQDQYSSDLPLSTVIAIKKILPNIPQLIVDTIDLVQRDDTDIQQIISVLNAKPPWPCSDTSISELVNVSTSSKNAIVGFETLLCMNKSLRQEWEEYGELQKVRMFGLFNQSQSKFEPHLFLKFSNNFNALIKDTNALKRTLSTQFDSNTTDVTFVIAWNYAIQVMNSSRGDEILRSLTSKIDLVLASIITETNDSVALTNLWEEYIKCDYKNTACVTMGRGTWRFTLEFISVLLDNMALDLLKYFSEIYEPNANLLQLLGFTKGTGLYILNDKLTDFIGVLLNSYWDYGFMNQVRRAGKTQFWDCEAVVEALVIPPGSRVTNEDISKVKPYICPSLLYWVSLPRGENTLLDVVAKPQFFFYTLAVQNLDSSYQRAYTDVKELIKTLADEPKNLTIINENELELNTIDVRFKKLVDKALDWKIIDSDPSYKLFSEINKKQFVASIYLTRVVSIVSKIQYVIDNFKSIDTSDISKETIDDLSVIEKKFKRRPTEVIGVHFDILTQVLWNGTNLVGVLKRNCEDLKLNMTKSILADDNRFLMQICSKNFEVIYGVVQANVENDFKEGSQSLRYLVDLLKGEEEVADIFQFFNQRKQITNSIKTSIKYADDISIPIYLKYLQTNLQHYRVILSFISGEEWWKALRDIYNGPYAASFFDMIEKSVDIAEDFLGNVDQIHLVRLLKDINVNDTDAFCQPNITLSDYIPDRTGLLSTFKQQICDVDTTDLYAELPLMVIVSQGYDSSLTLSREINYTSLNQGLTEVEAKLLSLKNGPKTPVTPSWVSKDKIDILRKKAKNLLSKEMVTKMSFGVIGNVVDASTLFLNTSHCNLCSTLTTWFKQLNLQLFKKLEYDNLLCHMNTMSLDDIHGVLKNDFHWDMALKELISSRNYTKFELNKSINEFLDQMELHIIEDLTSNGTKLAECLTKNVSRNAMGNATLFTSILSHTIKLLRAELPHIQEIEGIKQSKVLMQLEEDVAPGLHVVVSLEDILKDKVEIGGGKFKGLGGAMVDLLMLKNNPEYIELWLSVPNSQICDQTNCTALGEDIIANIQEKYLKEELISLQHQQFWSFHFITNILLQVENFIKDVSRMLGVASKVDLGGVMGGELVAILDLGLQILQDDSLKAVIYSLEGLIQEMRPLIKDTQLLSDLQALGEGLHIVADLKDYVINNTDLKINVSEVFSSPEDLERELNSVGIRNTNFWSIAAPRIQAGTLDIKPLLTTVQKEYSISHFACQMEYMAQVIQPSNIDVVTVEDIYGAVIEQFCGIGDTEAKSLIAPLLSNVNYSLVFDQVLNLVLKEVYKASKLTPEEGENVLKKYPEMISLLPLVQKNFGDLSQSLSGEPIFAALKNFTSVSVLLSSSEFLASAGNMMCGKPFVGNNNRFYKAIAESKDFSDQPDQMQLDVLPTDFCRSLYKDILKMGGGKIVWSFVKPLLMGRILFTPSTPAVNKIIEKANATFAYMSKMVNIIHDFATSFPSIQQMADHRAGVDALRSFIANAGVMEMSGDIDLDGVFGEFDDLEGIGSLLTKASNLLRCINLNRFHSAPDEGKLTNEAVRLTRVNEFSAGLVFTEVQEKNSRPLKVDYKIRMDIDTVPTTSRKRNQFWTPGPEANFLEDMRYFRGFVQIQDLVDQAIIDLAAERDRAKRDVGETRTEDAKTVVYTQQIPYPCYRKDFFQSSLYESQALVVAFFFAFVFSIASAIRFIVAEKESGNTMLMSVMNVNISSHTLSWFTCGFVELLVTSVCVTAVLSTSILPNTDVTLLVAVIANFCVSGLMFCYMISKMFQSASLASVCGGLMYLVTFMPYVIILSLEAVLTTTHKLLTCLFMSSSFSYSLLHIARYEAIGVGAHWTDLWRSPDNDDVITLGVTMIMVLVDAVLYFCIGFLIEKYFGQKSTNQQSNINNSQTNEKAGVSIVNITKIYGEGTRKPKVALNQVSIELHKGQITTLLGHNGAGKTTLIKIITGMLKPTKGHIVIGNAGTSSCMGVCPQNDILYDNLTVTEHLVLYAQLKSGKTREEVQAEVDVMISLLGTTSSNTEVRLVSGGMRRRLCVALAFLSEPRLVLLDEPSSGVDPVARRDIWSLIVKLKEDRTVLMTTHHLDEAELLSDQIVIMHKGQVHTTGSPVEIKRTFGNGYKLTVTYPEVENTLYGEPQAPTVEELSKPLLGVVRVAVVNASLVDVTTTRALLGLPFYDDQGLNNDFLKLCTLLESRREELGFLSFSMDCGSLEQVLANICQPQEFNTVNSNSTIAETATKSSSSSSLRQDGVPLVSPEGVLRGTDWEQFKALIVKRYKHYSRNTWLLFLLLVLPSLFVSIAMGFSMIRPPPDNEISLLLTPEMYGRTTQFVVPQPSMYGDMDPSQGEEIMQILTEGKNAVNWTDRDNPQCECTSTRQNCDYTNYHAELPSMLSVPNVTILNDWLIKSQEAYIEKRYGGYSSALANNKTNIIAWYNNKGHHSLPTFVNQVNVARLRAALGDRNADILAHTHPLKISHEQLSKSTLLQHVADAGISGMLLIGYSLIPAAAAIYLVTEARSKEKRLQLLCGVSPRVYWVATAVWDMLIIIINIVITVCVLSAFGFPVFVARDNLPAICLLLFLFGFSCNALIHVCSRMFRDASLSTMLLFCGNVFIGLSGLALLLIMDIISESERTDNARWTLHKIFMLSPQFTLGDGLLEIAKNTVQAQVLSRFGMDTYKSPLTSDLICYHYIALFLIGVVLTALNLAIEYGYFENIITRFQNHSVPYKTGEMEDIEVSAERRRVEAAVSAGKTLRLHTIGNINAGFTDTENLYKKGSLKRYVISSDVTQCVELSKTYATGRQALKNLTLGLPAGECTALLGENGAGKSTTFSILTGEIRPTSGRLYLMEEMATRKQLCSGLISYCPQSDAIDTHLTVHETLNFYCQLRGIDNEHEVIKRTLDMFDLCPYEHVFNCNLSGGNKRKLCAAIAFMGRSKLVLLDEPTSGMDPGSRGCVPRACITAQRSNRSILLSTHALTDLSELPQARAAMLLKGRLCALTQHHEYLYRFGGYVVSCRVGSGRSRRVWHTIRSRMAHTQLKSLQSCSLQFFVPTKYEENKKEVLTKLSDIFRVMAELQSLGEIDDYTLNQSSLDQMFEVFSDKQPLDNDFDLDSEPLPTPKETQTTEDTYTSL